MSFTYPAFLYALGLLIIPILIHLFNFRSYKLIRFSQVRFLKQVKSFSEKQNRLRHLLVLLMRILALACLILAFSKPFIPLDKQSKEQPSDQISIYLDNSFSMAASAEQGQIFDQAKNIVLELLNSFKESARFQIITNDFTPEEQSFLTKSQAVDRIQSMQLSGQFRLASEVVKRQQELGGSSMEQSRIFIVSDFQKNTFDLIENSLDSLELNLIPLQSQRTQNVGLDSLWLQSPYQLSGSAQALWFNAQNYSSEGRSDLEVKLSINNQLKTPDRIDLDPGEAVLHQLNYRMGSEKYQLGQLLIKDYPVNFDDTLYFNTQTQTKANILHIYEKHLTEGIERLFEPDSFFNYQKQTQFSIDFSSLGTNDLLILDGLSEIQSGMAAEIETYLSAGGTVFIIPSETANIESYNRFLSTIDAGLLGELKKNNNKVGQLNERSELFASVFDELPKKLNFPYVNSYFTIKEKQSMQLESILELATDEVFLSSYEYNIGRTYLCSSSLLDSSSNFTSHALFVPSIYNMALVKSKEARYHYLNEIVFINIQTKGDLSLRLKKDNREIIPAQRTIPGGVELDLNNANLGPGHYQIQLGKDSLGFISLNYSRRESNLELWNLEELKEKIENLNLNFNWFSPDIKKLSNSIELETEGRSLWIYFLIAALLFLGFETLLLRLSK